MPSSRPTMPRRPNAAPNAAPNASSGASSQAASHSRSQTPSQTPSQTASDAGSGLLPSRPDADRDAYTPLPPPQITARGVGLAALFWLFYALLYALLIAQSEPSLPFFFALAGQIVATAFLALYSIPAWWLTLRVLDRAWWGWVALAHVLVGPLYAWLSLESYVAFIGTVIGPFVVEEVDAVEQWILFSNLTVYALQFAVFHMLRSQRRLRWKEQQALELFALARERELEALKAQVNPHFLFNTLNSINATVTRDPEQARAMLVKLADLMRYALDSSRRTLVPLRDEVRFVRAYLDLERHRFSDRLTVQYDVTDRDGALDVRVPPMVLHPLVENALKHGIAPSESGGTVTLRIAPDPDRVRVAVADTGVGPSAPPDAPTDARVDPLADDASGLTSPPTGGNASGPPDGPPDGSTTGVGLANTSARLERVYGESATLHTHAPADGGFRVWFDVPLDSPRDAPADET